MYAHLHHGLRLCRQSTMTYNILPSIKSISNGKPTEAFIPQTSADSFNSQLDELPRQWKEICYLILKNKTIKSLY